MTLVPPAPDFQFVQGTQPSNPKTSDWWLDTSKTPPVAKVYDGSGFVKPESLDFLDKRVSDVTATSLIDYTENFTEGDISLGTVGRNPSTIPSQYTHGNFEYNYGIYLDDYDESLKLKTGGFESPRNWRYNHPIDANGELQFNLRFHITANGDYIYGTRQNGNTLYRWDFGTPWDLSTINTTASQSYSFPSGDADTFEGVIVGANGQYLTVADGADDVIETYEMSTPYSLNSISKIGEASPGSYNNPVAMTFSENGYQFYHAGSGGVDIWDLNEPYNTNNRSGGERDALGETNWRGIGSYDYLFFTGGGEYFWFGNNVEIYVVELNVPYELTKGFDLLERSEFPRAHRIKSAQYRPEDGMLYCNTDSMGNPRATPSKYDIKSNVEYEEVVVGFDDSSTTTSGNIEIQKQENNGSVTIDAVEPDPEVTAGYGLPTAKEGVLNPPGRLVVDSEVSSLVVGITFNDDGSKLYVLERDDNNTNSPYLYSYALSIPYDPSTGTLTNSVDLSTNQDRFGGDVEWGADGTQLFISDHLVNSTNPDESRIYEYSLSTAYDISTLSFVQQRKISEFTPLANDSLGGNAFRSFSFAGSGSHLYVTTTNNDNEGVYHYTMSTPYDITALSYSGRSPLVHTENPYESGGPHRFEDAAPISIDVSEDGKRMVYMGDNSVGEQWFETPYDIESVRWKGNDRMVVSVNDGTSNVRAKGRAIRIAPDGDVVMADRQVNSEESIIKFPSHSEFGVLPSYPTIQTDLDDGDDLDNLGIPADAKLRVTIERSDTTDSPRLNRLAKRREI